MLAWICILWGSDFSKASNSSFVANSSRCFHKISKIPMMPKIFAVLALLAHGAVSVRSGSWLSEGHLELEKVDEKKPQFVENIFKKARSLKGWIARKLGEKKIDEPEKVDEEKLVDYVQKRLEEELGINATRHQVAEFIPARGARVRDWTEEELESWELLYWAKYYLPLDVGASAVAFCGELVKGSGTYTSDEDIKKELRGDPEEICSQVLTGNLSNNSGAPKWAVKAAQVAEMDGQQHPYGRLDRVAWKHSLKRVCHDECEELVKGMQKKAGELADSTQIGSHTIEDDCADHVVKHVEAEILGCCSRSCGWNGQFCSFFPFLNSTEQAAWQAECCSERNILNGSTRQRLCDSTLSQVDKNMSQNLTDQRPSKAKDRETLAQDESLASDSWSLMERSFGGPMGNNTCPPPINLHKIHKELEKEWKRMPFDLVDMDRRKKKDCKEQQSSRDECKAFLLNETTHDQNEKIFKYEYICCDKCGLKPPANPKLEDLTDPAPKADGFLYVHKEIYTNWTQLTALP